MLKIKLQPTGKRHQHFYRVVVVEAKSKLTGSVLASLGTYNPHALSADSKIVVDKEQYQAWMNKGAQPTDTIRKLIK